MVQRSCSVEGCERKYACRGYCNMHYQRMYHHGAPLAGGEERLTPRGEPKRWLLENASYEGDDCIKWPFADDGRGYGHFVNNGRMTKAHRFMCEQVNGPPPFKSAEAAHSCGQGKYGCVNPRHLRWATSKENNWDKVKHKTDNRGERCGSNVLSEGDVENIVSLLRSGRSQQSVADQYRVHRSAVACIAQGRTWGWFTGITYNPVAANDNNKMEAVS